MIELEEMMKVLSSYDVKYNKYYLIKFFLENYSPFLENFFLKINSPIIFERFTNIMQYKIDTNPIEAKRDEVTRRIILNEIDGDTFTFFHDITPDNYKHYKYRFTDFELEDLEEGIKNNDFNGALNRIADKWLDEYIIYYFFHDDYYDYLINLNQMLRYIRNVKLDLINKDHLSFYTNCYNLPKLSFKEKVQFFKDNYEKKDTQSMFYDDMRIVKNHSYKNLVNSLLDINNASNIYNEKLSKEKGVPVYYLNGEKFNAIVRYISHRSNQSEEEYEMYINNNQNRDYYSFSFISDKNATAIHGECGYTLLFSNINPNYIAHVYHDDSGTALSVREKYFVSKIINEIHTPDSLASDTECYNELVIKKEEGGIKPSAVVCYDEIDDDNLSFAKSRNLPIVLINSKKYHKNTKYTDYDDYDTYSL